MRIRVLPRFLSRLQRFSVPVLAGGSCAALVLAMLAGFVPGREGGEIRMPVRFSGPEPGRLARLDIRPLDTTTWMVRLPVSDIAPSMSVDEGGDESGFIEFSTEGVALLTDEGPRFLGSATHPDLMHELNRRAYGLPLGLTFDYTAVVNGTPMPWCSPLTGAVSQDPAGLRKAWLRRQAMPYGDIVTKYVERFNLSRELVYAIMYTESGFNPLAISNRDAHGLMQIVPQTAGGEVYRYLHGHAGIPRTADLLQPAINIQYGITYLHLLMQRHMGGVENPLSREYCAIAAYNTGSGTVYKLFGGSRDQAFAAINSYTPAQVYDILQQRLPSMETKVFLRKVLSLKNGLAVAAR